VAAFSEEALAAGADGVLVVDLPPEESDELTSVWGEDALAFIRLVAPTTPSARMAAIAAAATGFIYLVSNTGVTGSSGLDPLRIGAQLAELKAMSRLPVCVGFGISTPAEVARVARVADGVVIGSAFERIIEEGLGEEERLPAAVAARTAAFKAATRDL
jgi:tryptophan synthase alpha chain